MMLERALRLIHDMAAIGAHLSYFFPLLGQLLPYYVGMALPAALMIALVMLIARLDESLELEAMLASGLSLARIALPLVAFSALVAAAALATNGFLEPQGRYGYRTMRAAALQAARIGDLQPGAFYQPAEGLTLRFERRGAEPGRVEGVFAELRSDDGRALLLTARSARLAIAPGRRTIDIELEDGVSYQDADPAFERRAFSLAFRRYRISEPILPGNAVRPRGGDQKELTVAELIAERRTGSQAIATPAIDAELYSRLARSLSVILLPLLAIPLSFAAKKGRRGFGIALGGAVLMTFHHGINTVKSLSIDGSPDPATAFALLTGAFSAFVLWLFAASRHLPSHGPLSMLLGRGGLAGRMPRVPRRRLLRLPGGRIGGYVAGRFALWAAVAAVTVILLLQLVDLVERGDEFVDRGLGLADVGRYALLRLPLLVQQTIAIAALAGAMLVLLRLVAFSEMVAIRAAGLSLRRLLLMMMPVAAVLAGASLLLAERITPRTDVALAAWWRSTDPKPKPRPRWFRLGPDIVRAEGASANGAILRGITVFRISEADGLEQRLSAASARPAGGGWTLSDVETVSVSPGGTSVRRSANLLWPARLDSAEVRALFAASPQLSSDDARRALAGAGPVSEGPPRFETRIHRRAAEPLAPFVMLLLALPLALASSRTGPSWPRLLYPVVGGMAFLVSDGVLTVAAQTGMVQPWIGAWTAPIAFGLIAVTVLVYSDA